MNKEGIKVTSPWSACFVQRDLMSEHNGFLGPWTRNQSDIPLISLLHTAWSHVGTWLGPQAMNKTKSFLAVTWHKETLWTPTGPESWLLMYSTFMCGKKMRILFSDHEQNESCLTVTQQQQQQKFEHHPPAPKDDHAISSLWILCEKMRICVLPMRCER